MGHSVASVWQLNTLGSTMEQKVKKISKLLVSSLLCFPGVMLHLPGAAVADG